MKVGMTNAGRRSSIRFCMIVAQRLPDGGVADSHSSRAGLRPHAWQTDGSVLYPDCRESWKSHFSDRPLVESSEQSGQLRLADSPFGDGNHGGVEFIAVF